MCKYMYVIALDGVIEVISSLHQCNASIGGMEDGLRC